VTAPRRGGALAAALVPLAWLVLLLAVGTGLAAAAAGLGHRWGLWDFRTGFAILRSAAAFGLSLAAGALLLLIVALVLRRWRSALLLVLAIALGGASVAVPWLHRLEARRLPPIHDITTDTRDPPRFVDVVPLRRDAPNPVAYGGPRIAAYQLGAYDDIGPISYRLPPREVFPRVLKVVEALGWNVVAAVPEDGRIEATDRTFWFGFVDDIVVRIRPEGAGSRVDIRSLSRVGVSDLGTNARRIRAFLDAVVRDSAAEPAKEGDS
jgi:uncharacterized protein (DUF1499 family)